MADSTFVFVLIAVAGILMASNRVRFDVVALLVVLTLMLSGIPTVGQSLAGFGSSVVILVVGLLVVGEMLARTGVARAVGWPRRAGSAGRLPVTTRGFGCVHLCVDFGGEAGGAPPL